MGNGAFVNLELGAGMGEEWDLGAGAAMLVLKVSCCSVGIYVLLGGEGEVFVGDLAVLVAFDVLESGLEWEGVKGVSYFIEDIPIGSEGSRRRFVSS